MRIQSLAAYEQLEIHWVYPPVESGCLSGWAQTSHLTSNFANDNRSHYGIILTAFLHAATVFYFFFEAF
jgi:hypothetical protein